MPKLKPWHEQNSFWELWRDIMFSPKRLADARTEIDDLIKLVALKSGAHILDLCCGVGRHSLELARRGFKVTGVDITPSYLDIATARAKEEKLVIEFVREDMRTFRRPDAFDAIINMFTSFGFFEDIEDDRRVAHNAYASLKRGGRFLIDTQGKEVLARVFRERDWRQEGEVLWLEERKIVGNWERIESLWTLIKDGERYENRIVLRLYCATELVALLKSAGFKKVTVYGDLAGSPYDQNARRLVAVAEK
ncbi:MAG: methyltransferase domain-containing protein [Dehalococcoidia bacterium]|nr:methyltransferase domain-containing protein [Dehalococcoidia bacterium]